MKFRENKAFAKLSEFTVPYLSHQQAEKAQASLHRLARAFATCLYQGMNVDEGSDQN